MDYSHGPLLLKRYNFHKSMENLSVICPVKHGISIRIHCKTPTAAEPYLIIALKRGKSGCFQVWWFTNGVIPVEAVLLGAISKWNHFDLIPVKRRLATFAGRLTFCLYFMMTPWHGNASGITSRLQGWSTVHTEPGIGCFVFPPLLGSHDNVCVIWQSESE